MADLGHNGGPPIDWSEYGGFVVEARDSRTHHLIGYGQQVEPYDRERGFCYSVNEAWRDILHECRYRDGYVMNGGQKMLLKRGSMCGATSWFAHRWNWSVKRVRGFLDRLENDGMIALVTPGLEEGKQKGKQSSILTVCNYEHFNPVLDQEGQANGQAAGTQGASEGQAKGNNIRKNKVTRKQEEESPYSPPPGDVAGEGLFDGNAAPPAPAARTSMREIRAQVDDAVAVYNLAAKTLKFTPCTTRDTRRDNRIAKRLAELGGLERFKEALRGLWVPSPLTDYLLGRVAPKAGERTAFCLDIDTLLQTDGKLGNVLARLLDQAAHRAGAAAPQWSTWDRERWRQEITAHANGVWPPDKIGFWPSHPKCAAPADLIAEMGLDELYDESGIKRGGRHA